MSRTAPVLAVAVYSSGVVVACRVAGSSVGMDERLLVPYAPASTIGPCLTPCIDALSGVDSRVSDIGRLTSTTSPEAQVRLIEAYVPGVVATLCTVPLTRICAPEVHAGIRIRRSMAPPPVMVSRVVDASGYVVSCRTVIPRPGHVSTEGMNRFTYRVLALLWK